VPTKKTSNAAFVRSCKIGDTILQIILFNIFCRVEFEIRDMIKKLWETAQRL
jgi:hypothetical protein